LKTKNNKSLSADYRWLVVAFSIAFLIRLGAQIVFFDDLRADPDAYVQISENLVNHGVYGQRFGDGPVQPTAYRPPLYPLILSTLVFKGHLAIIGVALFHFLLGCGTIGFGFLYSRQFDLPRWSGGLMVLLVAMDPIQLRQSSLVMTESLATFLAAGALWYSGCLFSKGLPPWRLFLLGSLIGLAALCRPTFVIWAGLLTMAIVVVGRSAEGVSWRSAVCKAGLFLLGVLLLLSPWMARNQGLLGRPLFATTHGGYTIFLGNNPWFFDYLESDRTDIWNGEKDLATVVKQVRKQSLRPDGTVDELAKDRQYYTLAWKAIRERPDDFVFATGTRVLRFWSFMPRNNGGSEKSRWIGVLSCVWYAPIFLMAFIGLVSCFQKRGNFSAIAPLLPGLLMILAIQGLHLLYWSNMRMRAPLVVILSLLAVMGFQAIWERMRPSQQSAS
jgi:hypothetical protein